MPDERILLVSGIPSSLFVGEKLYQIFGEYGAIQQLRIGNESATKGCAIIVYELCDAAAAALDALNNYKIEADRFLRISVYDESRDRKALERRKRRREMKAEYKRHIGDVGPDPSAVNDSNATM